MSPCGFDIELHSLLNNQDTSSSISENLSWFIKTKQIHLKVIQKPKVIKLKDSAVRSQVRPGY